MTGCIKAELYKIFKSKPFKIISIVTGALALINLALMIYITNIRESDDLTITSSTRLTGLVDNDIMLLAGIFAAITFAADYSNGTARQYISRGISRASLFFGRMISIVIASLVFPIITTVLYIIPLTVYNGFGDIKENFVIFILRVMISVILATITYVLMTLIIAVPTKSIGASVGCICVFSTMVTSILMIIDLATKKEISKYWISNIFTSFATPDAGLSSSDYVQYGAIIAATIIILTAIEYVIYKKQEH